MAKAITTSLYTNRKGTERVGLQMDRTLARTLAGYEGEEAAKQAQTQVGEALIAAFNDAELELQAEIEAS